MTIIFLDSTQKVRKVCNNSDFSQKQYFSGYVFKVSAWLSNHTVCKIGLKVQDLGTTFGILGLTP
jgi:hypothetical protein